MERSQKWVVVQMLSIVAFTGCGGGGVPAEQQNMPVVVWRVSDEVFRSLAVMQTRPKYPTPSFKWGATGVAVAEVLTTESGGVESVVVLQAPDAMIAAALYQALGQWRVRMPTDNEGTRGRLRAKLVFYFIIEDGRGFVRSPMEM